MIKNKYTKFDRMLTVGGWVAGWLGSPGTQIPNATQVSGRTWWTVRDPSGGGSKWVGSRPPKPVRRKYARGQRSAKELELGEWSCIAGGEFIGPGGPVGDGSGGGLI